MKVLRKNLEARLRQMSPLTLTGIGMLYVLVVAALDSVCPSAMTFSLFYLLGVTLVGWYSCNRGAVAATSLASAIALATQEFYRPDGALPPTLVAAWNVATRLVIFLGTGWLTVELRRLTRNLEQLVEERTAQWKAEADKHKATSARLADVAEILGQLVNNISEVFWLTNAAGTEVLYVSPSYERVWGRNCEQAYSEPMSWLSAVHPADRDRVARLMQTHLASGGYDGEYRVSRPDGSVRWVRDRAFPVRNAQGEAYRVAGVAEDITEQREARRVLEMQARVLENMAEAVLLVDGSGTIKLTNPALDSLLGYRPGALLGQPLASLAGRPIEEHHREFEEYLQQVKIQSSVAGQTTVRRRDNTLVEVEYHASGLTLESEFFLVIVGQDITQRRREGLIKEVFLSLGSQLSTVSTPVEAARAIYAAADKLWKWDTSTLGVYSPTSDRMEPVLFCDTIEGRREEITAPFPAGLPSARMRRVMQQGAELILRRQGDPPPTDAYMFGDTSRVSASIMCVPLRRENQPVGMLSIQSYTPNAYTDEDLQTLQALADYCGGALERIQAEVALRQSEELNRTIVTTALDGFHAVDVAADPLGAITDVNDAYACLTGYSREELLQMRIADLEAKESPEEATRHLESIVASRADRFETRLCRKDGRKIDVEISASHLLGSNKQVFGFVRDITERKRADREKEAFVLLGTRLNEAESPLAAARAVCKAADQLWQWDAAVLQLYSVERDCLDSVLLMDLVNGERREVPPPYPDTPPPPIMRRIMESGPELILRTPADLQSSEFVAFGDVQRRSASLMYAPLRREGRAVGVLSIQSYAFNAYTPEDLRTLQTLADRCGGALQRIRAEEALRAAHDKLELRVQERTRELEMANAALRESERRLRLALDASNAGIWSWDAATNLSNWDQRFGEQYGLEPSAPKRTETWLGRMHPTDREQLAGRIQALLKPGGGDLWNEQFRVLHPVKGERWMEGIGRAERDPEDRVVEVTGINLDITERKRTEQALREAHDQLEQRVRERTAELQAANAALRESEQRYHSLVDNLNVGVYRNTPGPEGRFLQANPALARMLGYGSVEECLRIKVADTYQNPQERTTFLAHLEGDGTVRNCELRLKKKDGTPIYASVNATAHRGPDGKVDWLDGVLQDTTETKRAQEALRASEERYRALAETSPDAIFIIDRDFRVAYANSAAAALWNRRPEKIIGRGQEEIFPPEIARRQSQVIAEILAGGETVRRDAKVPFPGGERWLETRLVPMMDERGSVHSVMGVSRDITGRKRAEQQLADALDFNQRILAASPMGILAFKASGECIFANQAVAAMVGATLTAILGLDFHQIQSWQASGLLQLAETTLAHGETQQMETHLVTSYGKQTWIDVHTARFTRNDEAHLLCMLNDISARKHAEEARQKAERLQKAILDNIPEPTWLKDAEGRFLACNQALADFYGRPIDAIVGKTIAEFMPDEAAHVPREDGQVMQTRQPLLVEWQTKNARGSLRWMESFKAPLFNEQDEVIGLVGIARDLTDRKRAELGLKAQRDLAEALSLTTDLKAALKNLLEITMQIGEVNSGGVYLLNDTTGGMDLTAHHGASPEFVKAVSHWAPGSPQMRLVNRGKAVFCRYQDLPIPQTEPRRNEGLRASAFIPLCHERKAVGALVLASNVLDDIPEPTQLLLGTIATQAVVAITRIRAEAERRKLESQLLEITDREQARIGQDIHDGLCQQLVSLAFDANSLHRALTAKHQPEARMAQRLSDFLDESITEARELSRGLFPVRLENEGLPSALEELARSIGRRFKVRCRFQNRSKLAVKDGTVATHLYRIAQEAVTNAVKHAQSHAISISLTSHAEQLELAVADDGTGIRPRPSEGRTGLGLHIMNYRARSVGGRLQISPRPGGGTLVLCTLVLCCVPGRIE